MNAGVEDGHLEGKSFVKSWQPNRPPNAGMVRLKGSQPAAPCLRPYCVLPWWHWPWLAWVPVPQSWLRPCRCSAAWLGGPGDPV